MNTTMMATKKLFGAKKAAPKTVKKAPLFGAKKAAPKKAPPKKKGGASKPGDYPQWYGSDRRLFLPGGLLEGGDYNPVLDGSLPGDYGFDILNLATDKETLTKYRAAELIHARWAMLGLVGVVVPEAIASAGVPLGESAVWYEVRPFVEWAPTFCFGASCLLAYYYYYIFFVCLCVGCVWGWVTKYPFSW